MLFKPTHLARRVHQKKTIAIEPHLELLGTGSRVILSSKALLNDFNEGLKTIKTPRTSFLIDHCIYALQIRDKGFFIPYHGHRSIYDIYKLDCKNSLTIHNIKKDIFKKHFFATIDKFNIFDLQITSSFWSLYHYKILRFLTISYFKTLFSIKNSIIINLLFNNLLRKRALNKIRIHYSNKTLLNYLYRWLKG